MKKLLGSMMSLSPTRKKLASNYLSLSLIQAANYLIPLFVLPYIVRIIGPENFGILNYSQSFVFYFTIILNYSFDITATREISINQNNISKISFVFSSVFYTKLILLCLSTAIFFIAIFFVDKFNQHFHVYILTYIINIGFLFFPSWYYQGTENLTRTAIFNFVSKVIFAALVVLLVREKNDFYIYALSASLAQIFVGILAFLYPIYFLNVKLVLIKWVDIRNTLLGGLSVFTSNIAVSLYTTTNLIILGFYTTESEYGLFSASLKIMQVVQSLVILPMSTTLFPHIAKSFSLSRNNGMELIVRYTKVVAVVTLLLASFVFYFAEDIIIILFGAEFFGGVIFLRIMAFIPFFSGLNIMISVQGLLNMNEDRIFLKITIATLILSLVLNFAFVPLFQGLATAVIQITLEVFSITLASYYIYKILKRPPLKA